MSVCRLLAASGFSDRDISEFLKDVSNMGPNSVISDVRDIRRLADPNSGVHVSGIRVYDVPSEVFLPPPSDTALKIERLLIHDAGLTKFAAIELLSNEIRKKFPSVYIPSESRKGFRSWIEKLGHFLPEKELLHIATKIRNRSVHEYPNDWRLKE